MHRFIYTSLFTLLLLFGFLLPGMTTVAQANSSNGNYGLEDTARESDLNRFGNDLPVLVGRILGSALSLIGAFFFGLVTLSAFNYMRSGFNQEHATQAKNMLSGAIIGLILVVASYAITDFMFDSLVG